MINLTITESPVTPGAVNITVAGTSGDPWTLRIVAASALRGAGFVDVYSNAGDGAYDGLPYQPASFAGGCFAIVQTATDHSLPVFFVLAGESDTWYRCLLSIAGRINALGLDGLDPQRLVVYKTAVGKDIRKVVAAAQKQGVKDGSPACVVAPVVERRAQGGTNASVRTLLGCGVYLWQSSQGNPAANLDQQLKWRDQITYEFHEQPFPAVAEVIKSTVEPGAVFPIEDFKRDYDVQSLTIRCESCRRKVA